MRINIAIMLVAFAISVVFQNNIVLAGLATLVQCAAGALATWHSGKRGHDAK